MMNSELHVGCYISTSWSSVRTWLITISSRWTWSRRKWWRISICFVRECWTGLCAILIALLLSHSNGIFLHMNTIIFQRLLKPTDLSAAWASSNIFGFIGRYWCTVIFLRSPTHKRSTKKVTSARGRFSIDMIASPVQIRISNEIKLSTLGIP